MLRRVNEILKNLLQSSRLVPISRWLRKRTAFLFRFCICCLISFFILRNDEVTNYDQRFQLRGLQKVSDRIVVILIRPTDLNPGPSTRINSMTYLQSSETLEKDLAWEPETWKLFLRKILEYNPASVAIALEFRNKSFLNSNQSPKDRVFLDSRIFWTASSKELSDNTLPIPSEIANIGHIHFVKDDDGLVRRVSTDNKNLPLLAELATGRSFPSDRTSHLINFRGEKNLFKTFYWSQIVNHQVALSDLKDKIVFVGTESPSSLRDLTPVGMQLRVHTLAQVADNLLENRWIHRADLGISMIYIFLIALVTVFIISHFPQSVSFFLFAWLATFIAALSAWVFDSFYFWIPAFSPVILILLVWIIFVGYQVSKIERKNFLLTQEQKYLQELEQLKNNFVSLISHDLKTPLAKIQAVTSRLLTDEAIKSHQSDLNSIKSYSEELNKYIQSILQVLKVESRDFKLNKEVADINEVIYSVVKQLNPLVQESEMTLETHLEPLFAAEFDKTLMKEVILNLIENAIKYGPQQQTIHIRSWEEADSLFVSVSDSGPGIPPEDLENVWKKFARGKGQDLKTKGTGLGLYLVKYFVELHGGQVKMVSRVGEGTSVSFNLPLATEEKLINSNQEFL